MFDLTVARCLLIRLLVFFFFQAEDGIRDPLVTGVQSVLFRSLVGADLELLAALLVHVGRAQGGPAVLDGGQGDGAGHARARAPRGVDDLAGGLVQDPVVVRLQPDPDLLIQHHDPTLSTFSACPRRYSITSVTVPAPTVWPPSRMAKRSPFSMAMGAMSSIVICVLSPGITISTPSGKVATPVTSVVRT